MALIVEDGTGLADAESYISVSDADTWHANRGNTAWAAFDTTKKEQLLRTATDYMALYAGAWVGRRVTATQALDWPRIGGEAFGFCIASDFVPLPVANACALLAIKATASGGLTPDTKQAVKRKKVGPLEVEYQDYSSATKRYRGVDALLGQYLAGGGNPYMAKLERS